MSGAKKQRREKNEMLVEYEELRQKWPRDASRLLEKDLDESRRAELWETIMDTCDSLRRRYAWAIPDERAIKILQSFDSLVEVGAGKGYWASLIVADGTTRVRALDRNPPATPFFPVTRGGPEDISDESTLFLCYPDDLAIADAEDDEEAEHSDLEEREEVCASMASLQQFAGDTIVLVGESFMTGTLSAETAPWGRSFDSAFQVLLATHFHMVLIAELPSWPISRDFISVWRRTALSPSLLPASTQESLAEDEQAEDDDGIGAWADIPAGDRVHLNFAAPDFAHLL